MEPNREQNNMNVSMVKIPPTHDKISFLSDTALISRYVTTVAARNINHVIKESKAPTIEALKYVWINEFTSDKGTLGRPQSCQA